MTSAVPMDATRDRTDVPWILMAGVKLGLIQSVLIGVFAVLQVRLEGPIELVVCGLIFLVGLALTLVLPGTWTGARTIEGIAGAAGVGLAAAMVFMLVDVVLFQPLGLWTNRWLEIGGGANWWYHPVWWMVGTYLTWMGGWVLANQAAKSGSASPVGLVLGAVVLALVVLALAVVIGVPRAGWNLGSYSVAVLPALAILVLITSLGAPRR
jgi:hypothetical protein